jgi:hypothetical protein
MERQIARIFVPIGEDRLRRISTLIEEIEDDVVLQKQLKERLEKGDSKPQDNEKYLECMTRLKQEIKTLKDLEGRGIEGIIWGGKRRIDSIILSDENDF